MLNTSTPWLICPEFAEVLSARLAGVREMPTARQLDKFRHAQGQRLADKLNEQRAAQARIGKVTGRVAVLPMQGCVEQRATAISYWMGGFSCEQGEQALNQLLAAKDVDAIVLDVDSPGGSTYGVEELSDRIFDARAKKPIYACSNSLMASAAYWLGSSAGQVVCTPSGDAGSVGVYCMHVDYSGMLQEQGIKVTFVKAAKFKAEGNPYEPLSDAAKDNLQSSVDQTYAKFTKSVARNRGVPQSKVKDTYGQGRCMSADECLEAGMIDRIMTMSQLMEKLTGSPSPSTSSSRPSAEVLRLRQERRKF